ncbi:MAG: hypothetical protein ACK4R9_05765 [Ignavibacterium sp.]
MDRIEAKEYLQAAALGCLDENELNELKELLEFDSELQFELASYQTLCALIPFSLEIINPGDVVKDNVALRLKRIEEELRAKREAELKAQMPEVVIEDTSEINEEIKTEIAPVEDLSKEISEETLVEKPADEIEIETPEIIDAPIPESYLAEDLTKTEDISDIPVEEEIISEELFDTETAEPLTEGLKSNTFPQQAESFTEPEVKEEFIENIEDIKYEEPESDKSRSVVESYAGPVKVEHSYNDSKLADITSRTVAEKLQKSFQMDIESIRRKVDKSEVKLFRSIISLIIICAILLALSIFLFFKFTADIKKLEQEIDTIKKSNPVGSLYQNQKYHSKFL